MLTFSDVPVNSLFSYDGEVFRKTAEMSEDGKVGYAWSIRNGRKYKLWGFCSNDTVSVANSEEAMNRILKNGQW